MEEEEVLSEKEWLVKRFGKIVVKTLSNGAVRFRVIIWDEGREPFLARWFNDPVPASDFLEKVKSGQYYAKDDRRP